MIHQHGVRFPEMKFVPVAHERNLKGVMESQENLRYVVNVI